MKLISYRAVGAIRIGCAVGEQVVDLNWAYREKLAAEGRLRAAQIAEAFVPPDMVEFLKGGEDSLAKAKEAVAFAFASPDAACASGIRRLSEVTLEAPVPRPGKIICVGLNYRDHIAEMGRELPELPVVFAKLNNTVIGPEHDLPKSPASDKLDYEAELAIVIGKPTRNVKRENALSYVAGYTAANDATYRDLQRRTIQWLQGKSVDGSCPLGPWLVTADEFGDPAGHEISLRVNGEERQRSNTSRLIFDVPYLVEFLSGLITLEPGDVVLTGTPDGVGFGMEPQQFLKDGDVVTVRIEGIGELQNRVRA